jgi:hypothetical protein
MKKIQLIFIIMIAYLSFGCVANTNNSNHLTKKEMQEDISFLAKAIKEINPYLLIRQQITGTDLYAEIDSLCNQAKEIKNYEDFYYLAKKMLLLCQDEHIDFQTDYPEGMEDSNYYISDEAILNSEENYMQYDKYHPWNTLPAIKCINGNYYFAESIYYEENNEEILVPATAQLLALNDIPIDEYVEKWSRKIDNSVRWDVKNKKYYTYRIYLPYFTGLADDFNFNLTFKYGELTTTRKWDYGVMKGISYQDYDSSGVLWFENKGLLYIRIQSMDLDIVPSIKEEIQQLKHNKIKKVVVDIRNNSGGNDIVWMEILAEIIDTPIVYKSQTYVRNTPLVMDYMLNIRKAQEELNNCPPVKFKNETFVSTDNKFQMDTISPSNMSLNYDGRIYVLVNEKCFSSSLAFISVCNEVDRLITVGEPTGCIGGRSTTPFYLSLPHSKLIFRIPPTLDMSNVKTMTDYYDHSVDIEIVPSIEERVFENAYTGLRYGKDFLLHHDSMFNAALNQ